MAAGTANEASIGNPLPNWKLAQSIASDAVCTSSTRAILGALTPAWLSSMFLLYPSSPQSVIPFVMSFGPTTFSTPCEASAASPYPVPCISSTNALSPFFHSGRLLFSFIGVLSNALRSRDCQICSYGLSVSGVVIVTASCVYEIEK